MIDGPAAPPAATDPAAVPGAPFDRAAAIEMMGDASLFDEIAAIFIADLPGYLAELDGALATADAERLARAAHTLKGLFATFVAPAGEALARTLDKTARTGDLAACVELAADLRRQVERLAAALAGK